MKEMFYLLSNTFYLLFYDIRHTVKDQSDSKRGKPLFFGILSMGINNATSKHPEKIKYEM